MKRLLASLLCATLIISPVGNASTAYAAETAEIIQTVETDEVTEEAAVADESLAEDAAAGEDEAGKTGESEDKDASAEGDSSKEKAEDTDGSETSGDETPSGEETPAEDSEAETDEEGAIEEGELEEDAELSAEDAIEEDSELLGSEVEDATDLLGRSASECFTVDADGTLQLVEGKLPEATSVIPAEAKRIPAGIFTNNSTCTDIKFDDDGKESQLVEIDEGAFKGSKIKKIEIPAGVTEIKAETFSGASSLTSVTFKGVITSIGDYAFSNTAIASISARNATTVGKYAFSSCSSLTVVNMESLVTVGDSAFSGCTALREMAFPSSITSIGTSAFAGCALTSIDLSDCKTLVLGENCFQNNDKLATLNLPNCLASVPTKAFFGDVKLSSVTFGSKSSDNKIRVIYNSAFENCSALTSVVFYNVYEFKSKAFENCSGLTTITIWNEDTDSASFSIAEDAFPNKSGVTMKGYDGKVQEYADRRNYKFESLYPTHSVKATVSPKDSATVKLSATKAAKGAKIKVTVTPAEEYQLSNIAIDESVPVSKSNIVLVENTDEHQVFEFPMPDGDEEVKVTMVKKGTTVKGKLGYKFNAINGYTPELDGDVRKFDIPGRESRLVITDDNGETNSWYWNYTSSNSKVVSVTNAGVVRSTGVGNANITATLKTDDSKKITVSVKVVSSADINRIELDMPDSVSRAKITTDVIDGEIIPVVQYERTALTSGAKEFEVGIKAYSDGIPTSLVTTSKWTTSDSKVASLESKSVTSNRNTVKIAKNTSGEALITVTVQNKNDKKPTEANTKSFIVRVVDATPRLDNSTLTVDSRSSNGTALKIVTVYGYGIRGDNLTLTTKKTNSKGVTTYPKVSELDVYFSSSDDTYYICNNNPSEPFEKVYEGTLYLEGVIEGDESSDTTFHIPITKLTVTNKALNPTIKTTGKINLFYNTEADDELKGSVTVTQSLKDLVVDKVELVSAANYKNSSIPDDDKFAANFDITKKNNTTFEVTRTSSELEKADGKPVTSGYIRIKYKGYTSAINKAITIPTVDTAPDYVLDKTSATASLFSSDQSYELHLVDKKTKKVIQDLSDIDTDDDGSGNMVGLGFTTKTTDGVFKDLEATDDTITLQVDGTPRNAKAYIYVKMTTWSREMVYTFTLKTTTALPTVKFSSTTATLNKTYAGQAAELTATDNQPEAEMSGIASILYTGKNTAAANELISLMETSASDDKLTVKFALPTDSKKLALIPKGTYSFKVTPEVEYNGADTVETKAQTIKVVVNETLPTIKFNSSTFKFNAEALDTKYPSAEKVERTFKIGNLPTGVEGTTDGSAVKFIPVNGAPSFDKVADITFSDGKAVASIETNATTISNKGKTLKYKVSGLAVATASGDKATIPDFTIGIQLDKKTAVVKVTGTGAINPIDASSKITYTATLTNISSEIADVVIWEKNGDKWYGGRDPEDRYSEHFEITQDDEKSNVAYLTMKDDTTLVNGKKYSITAVYTLAAMPGKTYQASFTVVPKQTLPKITTDLKELTIYSGQTNKSFTVTISQKDSKNMMDYQMIDPEFAEGTSAAIKKAFKIKSFDDSTGEMVVELVNSSALVQNSTYTLDFVTRFENQAEKSVGNKFSVKVTLKK